MSRFVVHESVGFLSVGNVGSKRLPGATCCVLDTAYLSAVVALYRSEDLDRKLGNAERRRRRAREFADAHAERLNDDPALR